MPPSPVNGATLRHTEPRLFHSARHIAIPTTDVVSYAFATYGTYDVDKPIYVEGGDEAQSISAREARTKVRHLISGLKKHGLQSGDCVCIHAYNNIFYPLLWLGVIGAGGCVSGTNPSHTIDELKHHFRITNTKFVISQKEVLKNAIAAAESCGIPASRTFVLGPPEAQLPDAYVSAETLYACGESDWESFDHDEERADRQIAVLSATSGTTGLPKSAALSHRYVVAQSVMIQDGMGDRAYEVSQLVCLPVWHAFQAQLALLLPLRLGIRTYFAPKFNLKDFKKAVSQFGITDTAVVPPIITALVKLPTTDRPLLKSLRYIVCAGAPMNARVQTEFCGLLPSHAIVTQCWGLTEAGWVTLFGNEKDDSGSVGRLLPNVRMRIVDEEGSSVVHDDVSGEAVISSPSMIDRYLNEPGATSAAFEAPGFFRTGDRVHMSSGRVFVDGRIKDIIKVNGWQVSPAELEAVLMQHPQVHDVAVVGVNSRNEEGLDESRPRAFVVLESHPATISSAGDIYATPPQCAGTTAEELLEYVSSRLVSYKRLSGGIAFVEKIPRSATGKILRRLLMDRDIGAVNDEHLLPNGTAEVDVDSASTAGVSFEFTSSPSPKDDPTHVK